jgi:hypothetical protein
MSLLRSAEQTPRRPSAAGGGAPRPPRRLAQTKLRLAILPVAALASLAGSLPGPVLAAQVPCTIDRVGGSRVTGGDVWVLGWATDPAHGTPVENVRIKIDGAPAGEVRRGLPRPDVMQAFKRSDYDVAGWFGTADLTGVQPGRHHLQVEVIGSSGEPAPCGSLTLEIAPSRLPSGRSPARLGVTILLQSALVLAALSLIGLPVATLIGRDAALVAAPLVGLALFGVAAEFGSAVGLRPWQAALAAGGLALAALVVQAVRGSLRLRPSIRGASIGLAPVVVFGVLAVIPMSVHGDGAVLGFIDDGIRESAVADSIVQFGWTPPPDVRGFLYVTPAAHRAAGIRPGGSYLLAAVAQALGLRAHEVYSAATLATGALVVLGCGLVARRLVRGRPAAPAFAALLTGLGTSLLVTLYSQHLGSVLFAALFLGYLHYALALAARPWTAAVGVAAMVAGTLTFYPEASPLIVLTCVLVVAVARPWPRARRALVRVILAGIVAMAVNPIATMRTVRNVSAIREGNALSTREQRMVTGDTFYFPSFQVLTGLEPYRLDAPEYLRPEVRAVWDGVGLATIGAAALGLLCMRRRHLLRLAVLLLPIGAALLANRIIGFPYGYAKFLPVGAALVSLVITACLVAMLDGARSVSQKPAPGSAATHRSGKAQRRSPPRLAWRRLALGTGTLLILLRIPVVADTLSDNVRAVPAYDPDYRELPQLTAQIGRRAVVRIDEPLPAKRQWLCYFLGENAYETEPGRVRYPDSDYYRLVDLREDVREPGPSAVRGKAFALVFEAHEKEHR